jgi:hypothetical protein
VRDDTQILESVVGSVAIDMVYFHSFGNWTSELLDYETMYEAACAVSLVVKLNPQIAVL